MPLFSKKIVPTDITANIEKATHPSVNELDWALVFQLCDSVNSTEMGAKEARKLLQKKMTASDPKIQVLALEILNSLSENCAEKFKGQISAKSFGEDLNSLASSKSMDDRVHRKLAQCLGNWVNQYGNDPAFHAVRKAYDVMMNGVSLSGARQPHLRSQQQRVPREQPQPMDIDGDIELAKNNAQLFSQTLSFTDPTAEDITQNELIKEFRENCERSQKRLASHLETCNDPEVISSLINANNELLSCFKSYDDMIERHAVSTATLNSQSLNHRGTRDNQQQQQLLVDDNNEDATHAHNNNVVSSSSQAQQSSEPFDPFADTNEAEEAGNTAGASMKLPPPLTPQKMHD